MTTLVLKPNNFEEITSIMKRKFCPKLKTEDDSTYFSLNNNTIIGEQKKNNENNTFNQMSFLFPSLPIEVSKINYYIIFYYRKLKIYLKLIKIYL